MSQETGANSQPRMIWKLSSSPTRSPAQPIRPLNRAITPTKASRVAPTATAMFRPAMAPSAAASITLVERGISTSWW
ncbi:hypothetical protein D3C79_941890 [compost metagenome]